MAMLPFCGYNMGDYFKHWLEMGEKVGDKLPKIFHVNWFRTDEDGKFIWPGFGDNMRVIMWILKRCANEVDAIKTQIGYLPKPEDIDVQGLDISEKSLNYILSIDKELWQQESESIEEFFKQFGDKLPAEFKDQLQNLKNRLKD